MNFMADEDNNIAGSVTAGSPDNLIKTDPSTGGGLGESGKQTTTQGDNKGTVETVPKSDYETLESKLGEQGKELGDYREFIGKITPVLNVLEKDPAIVQALIDGKINGELAKAALEGKVTIQDAATVTEAHKEVKKDLGKEYEKMSPEDIEKLVEKKAKEIVKEANDDTKKELTQKMANDRERQDFEKDFDAFANTTSDLIDYLPGIEKWFDENPDQYNIRIAYDAVKGKALADAKAKADADEAAEKAKEVAANAAGGGSQNATMINDKTVIDTLISHRSNPNVF